MNTRARLVVTSCAGAVLLLAASIVAHVRSERALVHDWGQLRAQARHAGLDLIGTATVRSGWPFRASLTIDHATLGNAVGTPRLLTVRLSTDRLVLHRSFGSRLLLRFPDAVTIATGMARWQVWGDARASATPGLFDVRARSLRLTQVGGPDDVVTVAVGRATASPGRVSLCMDHLVLPRAAGVSDRTVEHVGLDLVASGRTLSLRSADMAWVGSVSHLQGTLHADQAGALSGRLTLTLGGSWRGVVDRAVRLHLVTAAEGQAAVGLLALVTASGARDLPLAVQDGRVSTAGLLLLSLPAVAASVR